MNTLSLAAIESLLRASQKLELRDAVIRDPGQPLAFIGKDLPAEVLAYVRIATEA